MPFKDKKKARKASRDAMRRKRAGLTALKGANETVKPVLSPKTEAKSLVTDDEIECLSQREKDELARVTGIMAACGVNNLRERQEAAVRRLRGY